MVIKFSASADKHQVPNTSAEYVALTGKPEPITTNWGEPGTMFVGVDDRGVELEVITVVRRGVEYVKHAMPTSYRFKG